MEGGGSGSVKKEKKSDKKSEKKKKSSKKDKKRSRDESKQEEVVTTPVAAKKAKEEDVKKVDKKKKPKEARQLRHFPLSPIAQPLATAEQQVALFALLEKAAKAKHLRRGVKEIQKALRKKEQGVMVLAGDVEPLDVISHIPVLCEDFSVPYIYVRSKEELGAASCTKRPTSCILIKSKADYQKEFDVVKQMIKPVVY